MCSSLVLLVFSIKMRSRHWHTGMQIPAASKNTFQSPNLGPDYWPNAFPRDKELIKQMTATMKFSALLVQKSLCYKLGSHLE